MNTDERKQIISDLLSRGIDNVVDKSRLEKRLLDGDKLRVKFGIDPTSPNIHIGRTVPILKLKKLQELGCKLVLIVGDFTGLIGDTSDKNAERPMLTKEIVDTNLKTYVQQFKRLVDIDKAEIHYNSEWLGKLSYWEICDQADKFSLNDFISRINIKKRLDEENRVSLRELFYPLMQGYDSVMIKADLEVGGSDQWFNLLSGRSLQKYYNQEPQDILTTGLINGLDGRKMSSSYGNVINIMDQPEEMYGKVMSMKDDYIIDYFIHCTEVPLAQVNDYQSDLRKKGNPRDIKAELAFELVKMYWGERGAVKGRDYFDNTIRKKEIPNDLAELKVEKGDLIDLLLAADFVKSRSEARRVIEEGGVKINGETVNDPGFKPISGSIVQKGKRQFAKITLI